MIWTQLIKWVSFNHLIKEAIDVSDRSPDIVTQIPEKTQTKDGYLQYYEEGLRLRMDLKEGDTIVGSSWRADCVVASPEISPEHAVITRNGENYSIRNISPKGETYVNSILLPTNHVRVIRANDVIILSGLRMEFRRWAQTT